MEFSFYIFILEILFAVLLTVFFIRREKPKLKFLFLGYLFFLVSLILQLPFKFFQVKFSDFLEFGYVFYFIFFVLSIIVSELTKYFSLRKFLKTKSLKNGILFGIGWASLESINFLTGFFYWGLFSFFSLDFNLVPFIEENFFLFGFLFFFVFNLALTVLVVMALLRKNLFYLFYAIFLSLLVGFVPFVFTGFELFENFIYFCFFVYSLYVIFHYRKLK